MLYIKTIRRIHSVPPRIMVNFLFIFILLISSTLMLKIEDDLFSNDLYAFAPADSDTVVDYFPLNVGDWRLYESTYMSYPPELGVRHFVFDPHLIEGKLYYGIGSDSLHVVNYRSDTLGNIYRLFGDGERVVYPFGLFENDSFMIVDSVYGDTTLFTLVDRGNNCSSIAGSFQNCITILVDVLGVFDEEQWFTFAPDVGTVLSGMFMLNFSLYSAKIGTTFYGNNPPEIILPDTLFMQYDKSDTLILSDYVIDWQTPDSLLGWIQHACTGADSILCVLTNADTAFFIPVNYWGNTQVEFIVFDRDGASDTASIVVKVAGPIGIDPIEPNIPEKYSLSQNFPNPFNPVTVIRYSLPTEGFVSLSIFDISGRLVDLLLNDVLPAGYHELVWDASNVSSGVYFYRLTAANFTETKKMVVLK